MSAASPRLARGSRVARTELASTVEARRCERTGDWVMVGGIVEPGSSLRGWSGLLKRDREGNGASVSFEIEPLLRLSPEERLEIIDQLWESMDVAEIPLSEAQLAEVLRRKALYEANPESGYTLEEALEYASRDD